MGREEEQPRLAVLQKFRDISRVMTDTFLKTKKKNPSGQQPDVSTKQKQQQDYAQKMISIMKEMQSPRKFNSPLRRRNFFAAKQLPLPIR